MTALAVASPILPTMTDQAIDKVRALEAASLEMPQARIDIEHALHAGMYWRTLRMGAGLLMTGALIKIPTLLILDGDVTVFVGEDKIHLTGHNVLAGMPGRKQAFVSHSEVAMTMVFPTDATTVEAAEEAFTDEFDKLTTRRLT